MPKKRAKKNSSIDVWKSHLKKMVNAADVLLRCRETQRCFFCCGADEFCEWCVVPFSKRNVGKPTVKWSGNVSCHNGHRSRSGPLVSAARGASARMRLRSCAFMDSMTGGQLISLRATCRSLVYTWIELVTYRAACVRAASNHRNYFCCLE